MITVSNIRWINYQGVLIPDEAPDTSIKLNDKQFKYLLKVSGAYFIRWVTNFDCGYETEFWYLIKDGQSTLESLSRNTRHNVRRGLKHCIVKRVSADVIADEGYETYRKAFEKYETFIKPDSKNQFVENILSKRMDPQWDFWGVWNLEKKMIGYNINQLFNDRCSYAVTKLHPEYLRMRTSESLFFTMNCYYLDELGMKYISNGTRSLSHKTNIQDYFIDKFNFRKAYCRLHIKYSPRLKVIIFLFYPFRKIIKTIKNNMASKLTVLLKHEEIRRSFE